MELKIVIVEITRQTDVNSHCKNITLDDFLMTIDYGQVDKLLIYAFHQGWIQSVTGEERD